jgi:hypothetical protein
VASGRSGPSIRPRSSVRCTADPHFPSPLAVPEASGAAQVELTLPSGAATRELLVTSDSGGNGAALAWAIPGGPARAVRLPLDDAASDDLEGLAWHDGHLFALTSSGAMRRFTPALVRDQDAYAIASPPLACDDLHDSNCAANFEGLCLRNTRRAGACDGYAASKALAGLYCLAFEGERLMIVRKPLALPLAEDVLSDCAFGAPGPAADVLLVTTNVFGGSQAYVVDEATGDLSPLDVPPLLNDEAIAVDGDGALYTLMDDNGKTSGGARYACSGW